MNRVDSMLSKLLLSMRPTTDFDHSAQFYHAVSWAEEEALSIITPELGGDMLHRFKDRTTLG